MAKRASSTSKYNFNMRKLCTPSFLYFVLSLLGLVTLGVQNLNGNDELLCVGNYNCHVGNKTLVFILHGIYILFWTFILDMMCKNGYSELSWFIILIPFLLFAVFLGMIIYQSA